MDTTQLNTLMQAAGMAGSSGGINMGVLVANLLFGLIGGVALMYGWKNKYPKPLVIGLILSVFPYFVSNVWLIYAIGIALTLLLIMWRD